MRNWIISFVGFVALAVLAAGVLFLWSGKKGREPLSVEVPGVVVMVNGDEQVVGGGLDKPLRYQKRKLGERGFVIAPQAWTEGQDNCRVDNGSVVVCSVAWQGYADLVQQPRIGAAAKQKARSKCADCSAAPGSGGERGGGKKGKAAAPPEAKTSGDAAAVEGGV